MMELWYAPTSPFARKVRIAAHELRIAERISLRQTDPWNDAELRRLNPLAKVPTLVVNGDFILYESAVICEYLDSLDEGGMLFPPVGRARWDALLRQGLADGASTAAGRLFAMEQKPVAERDAKITARFEEAIGAALDALDAQTLSAGGWTIGEVGAAAFIGYLGFRWPEKDRLATRPALAEWWAKAEARPSIAATRHRLPTG